MTDHAQREYAEERLTNSEVPPSIWKDPMYKIVEKSLWDKDGNPLYTHDDLYPVYEGSQTDSDGNTQYDVNYHILPRDTDCPEFHWTSPPTKKPAMMIYFYEDPEDGTQSILYTTGEEQRFDFDPVPAVDVVEFGDVNDIKRFTQRGYSAPPSHYSHVRVLNMVSNVYKYKWITLVPAGIKKRIAAFTMSNKELEEFTKKWMSYDKDPDQIIYNQYPSGKNLFEHMGI